MKRWAWRQRGWCEKLARLLLPPQTLPAIAPRSQVRALFTKLAMQPPYTSSFPRSDSDVLPDPSAFFAPHLLSSPLPTNSFFQNFVLRNGDVPEYIHPYLVRSSGSSGLTLCYPSRVPNHRAIFQAFSPDLTISAGGAGAGAAGRHVVSAFDDLSVAPSLPPVLRSFLVGGRHVVSAFDDLSVTLDLPPALRFFLVRGSPYVTCSTTRSLPISISTMHVILSLNSNPAQTKHTVRLNNGQTFLVYSSPPLRLYLSSISLLQTNEDFPRGGVIRVAYVPDPSYEPVLDRFSGCYPVSGDATFPRRFSLQYRWAKRGAGDLLLLANPLQLRLLSRDEGGVKEVLDGFRYKSMDGELVGVVGDFWVLKTDPIPITWHSTRGVTGSGRKEVISALRSDVEQLRSKPIDDASLSYWFGKAIARAARLALIAEEVDFPDVIPAVRSFLKDSVTPWLDGSFDGNGFVYDPKWGGLLTKRALRDPGAEYGFGVYNNHHYNLGYFLYAISVLSKLDPAWGRQHMPHAYSMVGDFMSPSKNTAGSDFTRLRHFDLWKLHSWAGGLTVFDDGRNQQSSSEAVNAYYSAALLGLSYGDVELFDLGSTLAAMEIQAVATWWHVREGEGMYEEEFSRENRVVGVLWANKRDSGLWFGPAEWKQCRLGIQVLPLLPITEALFKDPAFVQELVNWAASATQRPGSEEDCGFAYALEGTYDRAPALAKTRGLRVFGSGNSLSNMLWWLHSR